MSPKRRAAASRPEPSSPTRCRGRVLREILELAQRAPSGGNLQPWRVYALAGAPLAEFKALAPPRRWKSRNTTSIRPDLWEPFRTRRFSAARISTPRSAFPATTARPGSASWRKNTELFGAPVGLFFCLDRKLGPPQWSDLGMFMQT